ncbi:MAG: putative DNA binding domain-containing protein [Bacteroidales bacterium]|nr:putative DNA binding domain-containing protein [Bacteroidales bacterium]
MTTQELLNIISTGETSKVQFKREMPRGDSILKEIVAMSNSLGGIIIFGVEDVSGNIVGLSPKDIEQYDRDISQMADNVQPTVYIQTEVVTIEDKNLLLIHVPEGINRPYKTSKGEIYLKQGANKRLLTDNSEIMRLFQQSRNLLADEMPVYGATIDDIARYQFEDYFQKEFGYNFEEKGLTYEQALKAKRVLRNGEITLAGLLFFGRNPQDFKPAFTVKLVDFYGTEISSNQYMSKPQDLKGTIPMLLEQSLTWVKSHLFSLQNGQGFNSIGKLEISEIALTEIILNALIHRDYYKNSPIRIMVFSDRVEIISPGKLPNSLTVEDIKYGNPVIRNNQMVYFSSKLMPYSGLGSGIRRALEEEPEMQMYNDIEGELFKVVFKRKNDSKPLR